MMNARCLIAGVLSCVLSTCFLARPVCAMDEEDDLAAALEAAKKRVTDEAHSLRYKFTEGETVRWQVRHLTTTETTMQGHTQSSQSRSISTNVWDVKDVDAEGNITFVHSVAAVNMWQKVAERPEVRYDSQSDQTPPPEYMQAAKTVGIPISTVKISPCGKVLERDNRPVQANFGLGDIAVPLPVDPVRVGQQWHVSNEVRVRREDGRIKRIKTRMVYRLESVKTGLATISLKTEVLTPINDPKTKSQLVQQITNGEIKFDLDAGRVVSREIDWDETVVGFSGDDSLMKYLARFTEELVPSAGVAQKPDGAAPVR